jgi:hypothetical protein
MEIVFEIENESLANEMNPLDLPAFDHRRRGADGFQERRALDTNLLEPLVLDSGLEGLDVDR